MSPAGSALERPAPPAGEEVHLPGGSLHPVLLTVGITIALVGVTLSKFLVVAGLILTLVVLVQWIAGARRELDALPADH
jgi:hypothetical protein